MKARAGLHKVGVLLAATVVLTSCGTSSLPGVSASGSAQATTPSTIASPMSSSTQSPALAPTTEPITATEADNGHTVAMHQGQELRLVLHSTYWNVQPVTNPQVLSSENSAANSPQATGCIAGAGCGTVTVHYRAAASGTAQVKASRTSCGEAMGCTAADSTWTLTVDVR